MSLIINDAYGHCHKSVLNVMQMVSLSTVIKCQLSPNVNCHPNSISSKHISRIYQCRYQKKSAISKSISISINAHTRRVQTERSQRREGSPRTWWSCIVVIIIIIYDDVSYMMMYIIILITTVNIIMIMITFTSLSEKNPPAKTPKDPPKTEAQKVHNPMS